MSIVHFKLMMVLQGLLIGRKKKKKKKKKKGLG